MPNVRIAPLPPERWGDAEKEALATFVRPGSRRLQPKVKKDAQDMSALGLFLNHAALAKSYLPFSSFILRDTKLDTWERELLILRVSWRRNSEYEWAQHVLTCQSADIDDEQIRRVVQGAESPEWTERDGLLVRAADELIDQACLSDETWEGLAKHFDTRELMEIIFVVGAYDLVAMTFNSLGLPLNENLQSVLVEFPLHRGEPVP